MFKKLYLVSEETLKQIKDRPALDYNLIYDAIVDSQQKPVEKIDLKSWLTYSWNNEPQIN